MIMSSRLYTAITKTSASDSPMRLFYYLIMYFYPAPKPVGSSPKRRKNTIFRSRRQLMMFVTSGSSEIRSMLPQIAETGLQQYSSRNRIQCSAILCDPTDKADVPDTEFYLHCRFSYQHFEPKNGFTRCFLAFEYIEQQRSRSRAEVTCPEIQRCYRRRIHIKIYAVIE